jgi:prophage antirepressor-like protein
MDTIIDIYNKILYFNDDEIKFIYDTDDIVWFKFSNIASILEYKDRNDVLKKHIDKKYRKHLKDIQTIHEVNRDQGNTIYINESGLYKLLTNSKKDLAQKFRDDVFSNILPTIRKTGKYNVEDKNKLKELNKEIIDLKNNQRNIKYPIGKAIYVIKKIINNKKYYKLGHTKDLNKRLKVYNTSNPNKILYKYFCLIENDSIDKCIKKVFKNKEFIKNKEYYGTVKLLI